jgi:GNAT superfamily N-acetyltransferase
MTDHDDCAPGFRVRLLVADDWAQLRAARLAALAEAPYAFASTLAREQSFDEELWRGRAGSGRTFAAFDGGDIVGLATGLPADYEPLPADNRRRPATDDRTPPWHLVGMWVAPDYRGKGAADWLVQAVCELARESGAATVTLWVTEVNARARAFYRRLGFAPTGARQPVRPDEPDHWEEELALTLG